MLAPCRYQAPAAPEEYDMIPQLSSRQIEADIEARGYRLVHRKHGVIHLVSGRGWSLIFPNSRALAWWHHGLRLGEKLERARQRVMADRHREN